MGVAGGLSKRYSSRIPRQRLVAPNRPSNPPMPHRTRLTITNEPGRFNARITARFGPVGSAALNLGTSYAMGKAMSDIRLKKDIQQIGATDKGLPVYAFRYLWDGDDESPRVGVMAQDVLKVMPDAVSERDGYLMVDYARI